MRYWLVGLLFILTPASAHEAGNSFRDPVYSWCCGEGDCDIVLGVQRVSLPAPGWRLPSGEFISEAEALPSLDRHFHRCHDPSGKRRCFFVPARKPDV